MSYLGGCIGILNEAPYLKEVMDYAIIQGFSHMFVYNNGSTDNFREVLDPYVMSNFVTILDIPQDIKNKVTNFHYCFDDMFKRIRLKYKWFMFASTDEFIYNCVDPTKTVAETLEDYEKFSGYCLPWKLFNSDGQEKKTDGLVIERFHTWVDDPSCHIKTIIQPDKTRNHVGNPHAFFFNDGYAVFGDGTRMHYGIHNGAMQKNYYPLTGPLITNHYHTMSREEFVRKMSKGRSDILGCENKWRDGADQLWNYNHSPSRIYHTCHDLDRYIPMLDLM